MTNPTASLVRPALVVIDVQKGFDDAMFWGRRDNPSCEANIALLIRHWRRVGWPVVFVRHDSTVDGSPLSPSQTGNDFKELVQGSPDVLIRKKVNSAFYGTPDLDKWLRARHIGQIVICGITTNHCCETTARMAGNLGYETYFALDATHTFDRRSPDGSIVRAETLSAVTATNLHGAFATVVSSAQLMASE